MSARFTIPGILATKSAQALPQTATANLFAVAGGSVLVTGLLGVVTTAIGATATTLSLGVATGTNTCIATATAITSAVLGTCLAPQASSGIGGALIVAQAAYLTGQPPLFIAPFVLGAGFTNITWTTSASTTGQVKWYCWYEPIDASATVS